ncbi:enoyl-CoA hydratase/isomerase family protein [Mariniblastus sp.]|nr:enoyl-CoA hydratase/isomerase family protein [Mariniblastus sp.]MDA7904143.1 enoyl-CoA hydratase/isomerase family protein [bacterium]MDA7924142.1 enoyl-CoA hydratase/isomerase family protein [Mariniblastus sp.]MDB4391953.1 enoyl-CoA hydratase/isomerase family protein [bacterium]MDB4480935.1 enoyl-CoA hydratase/isomerase family protein [bacterium]
MPIESIFGELRKQRDFSGDLVLASFKGVGECLVLRYLFHNETISGLGFAFLMMSWRGDIVTPMFTGKRMLTVENSEGVCTIRMNDGKVNAMDLTFCRLLTDSLRSIEHSDASAVLLTGNDRVFSAGVDLKKLLNLKDHQRDEFLKALIECFETAFRFPKPMVAAVNGAAIAGGCALALACDVRLIARDVKIGMPERRLGVPLPTVAVEIMRFSLGNRGTQDVVFAGKTFVNEEAISARLVDGICTSEKLIEDSMKAVQSLAELPEAVFRITKRQLRAPVIDQLAVQSSQFDPEVFKVWNQAETDAMIKRYIEGRL